MKTFKKKVRNDVNNCTIFLTNVKFHFANIWNTDGQFIVKLIHVRKKKSHLAGVGEAVEGGSILNQKPNAQNKLQTDCQLIKCENSRPW